jgi:hypothetical protein
MMRTSRAHDDRLAEKSAIFPSSSFLNMTAEVKVQSSFFKKSRGEFYDEHKKKMGCRARQLTARLVDGRLQ